MVPIENPHLHSRPLVIQCQESVERLQAENNWSLAFAEPQTMTSIGEQVLKQLSAAK